MKESEIVCIIFLIQVCYSQDRFMQVEVTAETMEFDVDAPPETTNYFQFTFKADKEVPIVIPKVGLFWQFLENIFSNFLNKFCQTKKFGQLNRFQEFSVIRRWLTLFERTSTLRFKCTSRRVLRRTIFD